MAVVGLLPYGRLRTGPSLPGAINGMAAMPAIVNIGWAMLLQSLFPGFVPGRVALLWPSSDRR